MASKNFEDIKETDVCVCKVLYRMHIYIKVALFILYLSL